MVFLVHNQAKTLAFCKKEEEQLRLKAETISEAFWELAKLYPEELIIWMEEGQESNFNKDSVAKVFHHDLIIASFAAETRFLDDRIGYVDELPFVNVTRNVQYPTWLMSADIGGIYGKVLSKFKPLFKNITDFEYLLNAIAKIGQQNGLFCYSDPGLVKSFSKEVHYTASKNDLFQFVSQFYKKPRLGVLAWCFRKYEKDTWFLSLLKNYSKPAYFQQQVELSEIKIESRKINEADNTVDVIIPTIGRPEHLLNVLEDLKQQTLLPKNVIIVEQKPDLKAKSDFSFKPEEWPFKIIHVFTHTTGACKARNRALKEITSNCIFLCDDDNRFKPSLIKNAVKSLNEIGVEAINTSYLQPNEPPIYYKIKQWGTFGSGNAFVKTAFLKNLFFDEAFEFGYGEDLDFGMQLRNRGGDIIFIPDIEITHLKAPIGGFRQQLKKDWEKGELQPKPSPTFMSYLKKNYTKYQILGYKTVLWIKFYKKQGIRNPFSYKKEMEKRWVLSKRWAEHILTKNSV